MIRRTRLARAATATLATLALAFPLAGTASTSTAANPLKDYFAPRLVTVDTPHRDAKEKLQSLGLDLTEHAGHDYVEVVLHTPADLAALVAGGFTFDVRIPDLIKRGIEVAEINEAFAEATTRSALPSGRDAYRTLEDYNADMAALAEDHPKLVKSITLPLPSLEGRTIQGVEIGSDVTEPPSGRPTFLLMGVHHAREWPSGELAMEFAVDLAKSYGKDQRITRLLDKARVVVVPVVNVDGFNLSRTSGEFVDLRDLNDTGLDPLGGQTSILATPGFAYMRKNCRLVDGQDTPDGACAAQLSTPGGFLLGVDLNRNYGGFWGGPGAAGSLPEPSGDRIAGPVDPTYRGAAPFSEPETQNIQQLVRERQVTMLISNHTFSNLVLRPNGVAPTTVGPDGLPVGDAPDEKALKKLGAKMTSANGYQNIHGWQLYDTTGTTEDWSYNATGGFGYTFEIGANEFHPPYPEVIDEYLGAGEYEGKGNREAYLTALEHAVDTRFHGVIKGKAPAGATLRLTKTFDSPTWESSFEDFLDSSIEVGRNGAFSWVVNPSTRPVVRPRTITAIAEEPFKSEVVEGGATEPVVGSVDHEYVVTKKTDLFRIDLDWPTPDDFDLEVYLKKGDELVEVGSSGNQPGSKEQVELVDAVKGTYVIRVLNFASVSPSYTLTMGQYKGVTKRTKGEKESYTLTCEVDGKAKSSQKVFIDRGQVRSLDLRRACR
ncbi:M14 family zinc carboxypeptidase [Nocardioides ginkgobilobae]